MKEETKGTLVGVYFTILILIVIVSGIMNTNKVEKVEKALAVREKVLAMREKALINALVLEKDIPEHGHDGIGGKVKR